jgi:hypothetical protein
MTHRGDVFTRELVCRVRDEQTRLDGDGEKWGVGKQPVLHRYRTAAHLSDGTVTDDNTLDGLHSWCSLRGKRARERKFVSAVIS